MDKTLRAEAVEELATLFLTRKIVVVYRDEEERDRLNAQRLREAGKQHEQIERILKSCGSWDSAAIFQLIERLQHKAENMISAARVLGMTTDPSVLLKYGVSKDDIDAVLGVHGYIRRMKDDEHKEVKSKIGTNARKIRSEKEEEKARSDLESFYERFNSPSNRIFNVKGKEIPRNQWGVETFCKFCEEGNAGYGRKMLRKAYKAFKALSSTP